MKRLIAVLGLISPLYAQQAPRGGGSILGFLFPLLLIFVIFYFLLILPQQRQEKKRKEMLANIKKGDRVVTTGGLIGTITRVEDQIVTLKIAQNTNVKVEKNAIRAVLSSEVKEKGEGTSN
jgi:preprotein translocase subunit YajC